MARPNRYPEGLLDLLDAKSLGKTPSEMADIVSPTLDMRDFYLASVEWTRGREIATAVTTVAYTADVVVPDNELWFVYAVAGELTTISADAGQLVDIQTVYRTRSGSTSCHLANSLGRSVPNALQRAEAIFTTDRPWLFRPGSTFQTRLGFFAVAPTTGFTIITQVLHKKFTF